MISGDIGNMVVYRIYYFEEEEKIRFVGFLPEKRKNPERITQESIFNYAKTILGHEANDDKIYYFEVTLDERIGEVLWPRLSLATQGTG
jgi:hypothetical protein